MVASGPEVDIFEIILIKKGYIELFGMLHLGNTSDFSSDCQRIAGANRSDRWSWAASGGRASLTFL